MVSDILQSSFGAHEKGINIIDCWMADPKSSDIIGAAIAP
jgi:hypothetical protein